MEPILREIAMLIGRSMAKRWLAEQGEPANSLSHQSNCSRRRQNANRASTVPKPQIYDNGGPESNG